MATIYSGTEPFEGGGIFRRVSWGAVFAGAVVALVVELVLTLLGMGIGLGTIRPATQGAGMEKLGIGAAIWLGITALISVFIAGWVTAKLAGSVRGLNGVLHSTVMWGVVTLFSFYLMTTAIGSILGGAAGVLGKTVGIAAQSPQIQQQLASRGITPGNIMNQANKAAGQAGQPGQAQGAGAGGEQMKQQALQTTEQAMSGLSKASLWIFVLMVLEAIVAAAGGWIGASKGKEFVTGTVV